MNLTELKQKTASEVLKIAQEMKIEGISRSRKQDVIFSILKAHAKSGEDIFGDGVLEILQDGFGFLRSADSSYLAPTTSTSLPARSGASTCVPATPFPERSGRPRKASATSRCSKSTRSTSTRRRTPRTRSCSRT